MSTSLENGDQEAISREIIAVCKVWDASTGQVQVSISGDELIAESPNGSLFCAADYEHNMLHIWGRDFSHRLSLKVDQPVANFSPDGKNLVTAKRDGTIQVWYLFPGYFSGIDLNLEQALFMLLLDVTYKQELHTNPALIAKYNPFMGGDAERTRQELLRILNSFDPLLRQAIVETYDIKETPEEVLQEAEVLHGLFQEEEPANNPADNG